MMLVLGDAIAVVLMNKRKFKQESFKKFHPGGMLGKSLLLVKDIMITGNKLPKVNVDKSIYDAIKKELSVKVHEKYKKSL